ncbi:MAG: tetratricopeptide repeat protein [Candidatus Thermoplasmatota archaeon]|nr:tetratricopeptide repeat protein [Candidatus Thermoplasmatota archaeon]
MNVGTNDLMIFSIGYLRGRQKEVMPINKKQFAEVLDVSGETINRNLATMRKVGMIVKVKKDGVLGHALAEKGRERYREIHSRMMDMDLKPDLHSVSNLCRLEDVIEYLRDPYHIVLLAYSVSRGKKLDVVDLIRLDRARRPGSKENEIINELLRTKGSVGQSMNELIEDLTLVGKKDPGIGDDLDYDSVPNALITAEMRIRRGRDLDARRIYQTLLRNRAKLDPAYWIFCIIGLIRCTKVLEGQESALELADRFLETVEDPAYKAMLKKIKADILQDMKRFKESEETYNSIIKTLKRINMPHLNMMVLNNVGVLHFRQGREDKAVDCWKKARTIAVKNDLKWAEAISNVNLSDTYAKEGNLKTAKEILRKSKKIFEKIDDQEGMSEYNFNMALVTVEYGNRELALDYFKRCEDFPLQYREKRVERREVINERFEKKGWEKPFNGKL